MTAPEVFIPNEHLNFDTVPKEMKRFYEITQALEASIHIDLSAVQSCDSAGLAFLLEVKRLCMLRHLTVSMINWPSHIQKLAAFVGVQHILLGEGVLNGQP